MTFSKRIYLRFLTILIALFFVFGCGANQSDKIIHTDSQSVETEQEEIYQTSTLYDSDSLTIDVIKDTLFNHTILLKIDGDEKEYDLKELNIPTKTLELVWVNQDYACIVTWWSQAFARHIFIPTKTKNDFIFLNKDIEEMDSVNNNIVYVDSIYDDLNKVIFKVENLLTRKSNTLEFSISRENDIYPYYEEINLTRKKLVIVTSIESKGLNIEEISSD